MFLFHKYKNFVNDLLPVYFKILSSKSDSDRRTDNLQPINNMTFVYFGRQPALVFDITRDLFCQSTSTNQMSKCIFENLTFNGVLQSRRFVRRIVWIYQDSVKYFTFFGIFQTESHITMHEKLYCTRKIPFKTKGLVYFTKNYCIRVKFIKVSYVFFTLMQVTADNIRAGNSIYNNNKLIK